METDHLLLYETMNRLPTPLEVDANLKYLESLNTATLTAAGDATVASQAAQAASEQAQATAEQSASDAATSASQALAAKNLAVSKADEAAASLDGLQGIRPDLASTAAGKGAEMLGTKQPLTNALPRTQAARNADNWNLSDLVPVDGSIVDGSLNLRLAELSALGGATIHCRAGTALLDDTLYVPDNIHLIGYAGFKFKVVGRDTHGRNSILFAKANGTSKLSSAIIIKGSNTRVSVKLDGNGLNNWYDNAGVKVYQDGSDINASFRLGYAGIRMGDDVQPTSVGTQRMQYNVAVLWCDVSYCGWGGIVAYGEDQRRITPTVVQAYTDLVGIDGFWIGHNTITYCNSNNLSLIGGRNGHVFQNEVVSAAHSSIKAYRNLENISIDNNKLYWDDNRFVSWIDGQSKDYNREYWFANRSEMLALGLDSGMGLYRNITVTGNIIDGRGKIFRGICCYGPMQDVVITGNRVTGVVRAVLLTPSTGANFVGNTLGCQNYVYVALNPGTDLAGICVALEQRTTDVEGAYTLSKFHFAGNLFKGTGVSLLRITTVSAWDTMALGMLMTFNGNTFDASALAAAGATAVAPIVLNALPAQGGKWRFRGNDYIKAGNVPTDLYDDIFTTVGATVLPHVTTDLLWKVTPALNSGASVVAGTDGTPRLVYDDTTGTCQLLGSVMGYTVGTTVAIFAAAIGTRFRPVDNMDFICSNSAGQVATVRVTAAGNVYVTAAALTGSRVSLGTVRWNNRY